MLASLMTNLTYMTHPKKGGGTIKLTTPLEFMPDWFGELRRETVVKKQSMEEMKQVLLQLAEANKKKVDRSKIPPPKFDNKKK